MVTLETADKALKDFYLDAIKREIDDKVSPFFSKIEKTSANVVGKNVTKLIKLGVNGGISAGTETGDLPKSSAGKYITLTAPLKNLYGTIEITDKALRASANNEGAFVNILNEEMDGLVKSAKYNFSRMLFGDGNGFITYIATASRTDFMVTSLKGVVEGMNFDVWKDGVKTHSNLKVISIDRVMKSIRVEGEDLIAKGEPSGGSYMTTCGTGENYELTGLAALFSDQNLYGVDRESAYMRPYIEEEIGDFSEDVLQLAIDSIEENSGSKVNMILCSWATRRTLNRYFKEKQTLFSMQEIGNNQYTLAYNGIPIVVDPFCPDGVMYLLNTDDFKICQLCDWQWMEGEDGKILKQVAGKPVYTATLVKYAELLCEKPCGQGVLKGIYY